MHWNTKWKIWRLAWTHAKDTAHSVATGNEWWVRVAYGLYWRRGKI